MSPKDIKRTIENFEIIGVAVSPDTNEIIPAHERHSSFLLYNLPILLIGRFAPNLVANDVLLLLS